MLFKLEVSVVQEVSVFKLEVSVFKLGGECVV